MFEDAVDSDCFMGEEPGDWCHGCSNGDRYHEMKEEWEELSTAAALPVGSVLFLWARLVEAMLSADQRADQHDRRS
jgi:hypothetical protein